MTALERIVRMPPEVVMLHPEAPLTSVHGAVMLRAVMAGLRKQADALSAQVEALSSLRQNLVSGRRDTEKAAQDLAAHREEINALIAQRRDMLQSTSAERQETVALMKDLSGKAENLRQLMEKVSAANSAPHKETILSGHSSSALRLPVNGRIKLGFGQKDGFGAVNRGLVIVAAANARVISPAAGKVVFAGPFHGYGQIVILQHDGGYHSLISGLGRIDVVPGQLLEAGEPLGLTLTGDGVPSPEIYFEWRHRGEPVDPQAK